MQDVEERLRALEAELAAVSAERDALRETVKTLELESAALRAAPIGVLCVSGRTGRYEFINAEFARLIGRDEDETFASDPFEVWKTVTHPDDIGPEQEAVARLARGEIDRFELDKRFVQPNGESRWVHVNCHSTRDANQRLGEMTVFFTDLEPQREIAEARDRLQAQLRRSQKLEALGKLAGGVAHDFNNRLMIIMGYAEIVRQQLPPENPLRQHAEMILTSSQRAADLTRQLLAYSRRQVLKPESFDVNASIDHMRRLIHGLMGDRIALETELAARYPIFADPGQMEQVIVNLAINARDAMPEGGSFFLETRDVKVEPGNELGLAPGDYVVLSARDTGTGIPAEVLPHIFEPFYTTKDIGQGSGLGLSMVEGIVQQSGGVVRVDTRAGQGSTFAVYLPRASTTKRAARYSERDAPARTVSFETVLVCDDDDDVRKLLLEILEFRAYRILEGRNGHHALELAREYQGPIHLLITDVVMPGLGGVELARELRARNPGLAVLFLSGYTEEPELLSVPLGDRTRFLAKPFLPGDLTSAVSSILDAPEAAGPPPASGTGEPK